MRKHSEYSFHGTLGSNGDLDSVVHVDENATEDERNIALADYITKAMNAMIEKGWIQFLSPVDLSKEYGNTRQFWEKLLKKGDVSYYEHGGGKFTLNIHVESYLKEKYGEHYPKLLKKALAQIKKQAAKGKSSGVVICPSCGHEHLEFHVNNKFAANANCKGCKFRINSIIKS